MGVDTRAVSMIGMWFESFDACLEYLVRYDKASEESAKLAGAYGDIGEINGLGLEWHDISCYSEEGGYLGLQVPCSMNVTDLEIVIAKVQNVLGDSIGYHNFVYWY